MVKMTIDDMEIEVDPGMTVLQACEQAGVEVPRFCYHERLSVAAANDWDGVSWPSAVKFR